MPPEDKRPALIPELKVTDFPRSRRFYAQVAGFAVDYERPEEAFAMLALGQARLDLDWPIAAFGFLDVDQVLAIRFDNRFVRHRERFEWLGDDFHDVPRASLIGRPGKGHDHGRAAGTRRDATHNRLKHR